MSTAATVWGPRRRMTLAGLFTCCLCASTVAHAQTEVFVVDRDVDVVDSSANGDVAPLRTIRGPNTSFSGSRPLTALAIDGINGEIFTGSIAVPLITVHRRAANGDVSPIRTLVGPATRLFSANAIALDLDRNELLVGNWGNSADSPSGVLVFERDANGNAAPLRILEVSGAIQELAVDPVHDELLVLMEVFGATQVLTFPREASGIAAPIRILTLPRPPGLYRGLALDFTRDEIVVVGGFTTPGPEFDDQNALYVFDRLATGTAAPLRTIRGSNTQLHRAIGVAVDIGRDELIVGNHGGDEGGPSLTVYPRVTSGDTAPLRKITSDKFRDPDGFSLLDVAIPIDTKPPTIVVDHVPPANESGWNKGAVELFLGATDSESGIVSTSGCGSTTHTSETAGITRTCTATDGAGLTASGSDTVRIDLTPPTITGSRTPPANGSGWNNTDVTVSYSCADVLSGIGDCSEPVTLSLEGASQSTTGTAIDVAGNTAQTTVVGINIDKTAPVVTAVPSRAPDGGGWYNHPFTVTWVGSDSLSGIATCDAASTYAGPDTPGSTLAGTCRDKADNVGSAVNAFKYDATVPTCTATATPSILSPPDHRLVPVTVRVVMQDAGGAAFFKLASVSSNEPDNGLGDGDRANDIQGFVPGTSTTSGFLRSERSGSGGGRLYRLTYDVFDQAGNRGQCVATVAVLHN